MGTFYTKGHKAIKSRLFKELLLIAVIYYFIVAIKLNQLVQFEKKGITYYPVFDNGLLYCWFDIFDHNSKYCQCLILMWLCARLV